MGNIQIDRLYVERMEGAAVPVKEEIHSAEDEAERVKLDEQEAARNREANKKHNAMINNEAVSSLLTNCPSLDQVLAKEIVIAIAKGLIDNVSIKY